MGAWESLAVALRALTANKMRSALTMLGVIIGVTSVILLVSIGSGVQKDVLSELQGFGSNFLFVMPGKIEMGGGGGPTGTLVNRLTLEHVRSLQRAGVTSFTRVIPGFEGTGKARYRNKTWGTAVMGVTPQYFESRDWLASNGRLFTKSDQEGATKVAVLGQTVYEELFSGKPGIGQRISISGQRFKVLGVLEKKGAIMGQSEDDAVYLPATTAGSLFGIENLSWIMVEAADSDSIAAAKTDVRRILARDLRPEEFSVVGMEEISGMLSSILGTLTIMLAGLAGISLLVGGIGIMNIMLVSVTERTREIGIRKAVGAKTGTIMTQFIIEAVSLSVAGGTVGILIGGAGAVGINSLGLPTAVTAWAVLMAFCFSAAVGVFFGVYPAYKASRLEPIEALRYE